MGMYTELNLNVELNAYCPEYVRDILDYMVGNTKTPEHLDIPNHPLFSSYRWNFMLRCASAYFPETTGSTFDTHILKVSCSLKNYELEIEKFLDWILPYCEKSEEPVGYHRYEEYEENTLIWNR